MVTEIGITAGEIWHFLDKNGQVTFTGLCKGIERQKDLVLMSLGWLSREGHVSVVWDAGAGDYKINLR